MANCEHGEVKKRCRPCQAAYFKKWYALNRKRRVAQVVKAKHVWRRNAVAWLNKLKSVPCLDCGDSHPPYVMDFDHVRGKKLFNISTAASSRMVSRLKLEAEVAKCEVVCANCHRKRTYSRSVVQR